MSDTRSYHHGNLRQALLDAALEVIERDGYQTLSLRELAQVVAVSRAAPYRHFTDRDALLTACACEGFQLLLNDHRQVMAGSQSPQEKAHALGRAFLDFAERRPGLFMLMFDSGLLVQANEADELGGLLHETYEQIGASVASALGSADVKHVRVRLVAMWSTLYGYARLRQSHMLKPYMLEQLSRADTENAVIAAAFGPLPSYGCSV
ncbi:TetR/AcrR family transcriptional regulator [Pseudomonas taeanensis]|uniref:TetR/AcrR family transcriptional regulator n=1 Tax=Pseudomonas taeanensis TaxID=574962 RepID=UPI000468283A|nr:TetR/AcrR family transcriptional regulator [Pseudomonas taeanensis]